MEIKPIAHIYTDFSEKFGIPRQSGLVEGLKGRIVFEKEYRIKEALREIESFSHLWLIWHFSESDGWHPTVRPPRLGGNKRVGVFASRSPFRPNALGLSCVKLEFVDFDSPEAPVLIVSGIDILDGTPIFDIKPYVPYADAHPEAAGGFTTALDDAPLSVEFPEALRNGFSVEQQGAIIGILERDPRPHYHDDPERIYGMTFAGRNVRFRVEGQTAIVCAVEREEKSHG